MRLALINGTMAFQTRKKKHEKKRRTKKEKEKIEGEKNVRCSYALVTLFFHLLHRIIVTSFS